MLALTSPATAQSPADCGPAPLAVVDQRAVATAPDCPQGSTRPKAAAETPIWRTIKIGTFANVNRLRDAFDAARIAIGEMADEALGRPAFTFAAREEDVDLVVLSAAELGLNGENISVADVHVRANELGFALCVPEVGPQLRIQYRSQPVGEFLRIAMKPVATYSVGLVDFTVANGGAGLALISGGYDAAAAVSPMTRFVFARPRLVAGAAGNR